MEGPELSEEGQRASGTKQGAVDLRAQGQPGIWRKGTGMWKGQSSLGAERGARSHELSFSAGHPWVCHFPT